MAEVYHALIKLAYNAGEDVILPRVIMPVLFLGFHFRSWLWGLPGSEFGRTQATRAEKVL